MLTECDASITKDRFFSFLIEANGSLVKEENSRMRGSLD